MLKKIYLEKLDTTCCENITPLFVQQELVKEHQNSKTSPQAHTSYKKETMLLMYIKNGEPEKLAAFLDSIKASALSVGDFSDDTLQQSRCLFIAAITLYTRFAIEGGLNEELAYNLSDAYIRYIHSFNDSQKILQLSLTSGLDFARRVKTGKVKRSMPVKKCCEYIDEHICEKITVAELARHCGRTPEYLSVAFANQLNLSPKEYIITQKLEAARQTLLTTDLSVSAIAQQYSFCNHSNFSMHFKRLFGAPPNEYRAEEHSLLWESMR